MKYLITLVIISIVWMLMSSYVPSSSTKGRLAPGFTVTLFEGKELRLKDLRGKVVLLNFWASWCPPCQNEATDLEAAWRENKDKGVFFLGINIPKDKAQNALRFLKNFGITYSSGWDDGSISRKYSAWGIPKTYIIGPKGRITYIHMGTIRYATIADKLAEARRGLITAKEGKGLYQSTKAITIDELAKLLESSRHTDKRRPQEPPPQDEYRQIDIHAVSSHRGQWVKILLKNGSEREGKVIDVKQDVIQLQQSFTVGSFSIRVAIQQIEDIRLLVLDGRTNIGQ